MATLIGVVLIVGGLVLWILARWVWKSVLSQLDYDREEDDERS